MKLLMYAMTTIILLMMMMMMTMKILSKKSIMDTQKSSPFECGFNPMSYSRTPFSMHFFLIAVIFLIFDIEIILMLPMIITMKTSIMSKWLLTSSIFVLILTLGLYHEWNSGLLKWTN